jgi:GTP cyclohydrolase II
MTCEHTLTVTAGARMPTRYGDFQLESFRLGDADLPHLAMSVGLGTSDVPLVRVHSECATSEVFGSLRCDCAQQLDESLRRIGEAGCGVLVYLRQEGRGIGIENKLKAYALQDLGFDTVDANVALGLPIDARSYRPAAAYLRHRGVRRCVLLTNNPEKAQCLRNHGIAVTRSPLKCAAHPESRAYLETKRLRLGQQL